MSLYNTILIGVLIYITINIVVCTISLFFIFRKAYIKGYYAFIPIVNLCYYLKVCKLKWYWGFIPFINIIVLFVSPYRLAYEFDQKKFVSMIGVLFPFLLFPFLAFSKAKYIHLKVDSMFVKSVKDIDKLEKKILKSCENEKELKSNNKVTNKKKDEDNDISSFQQKIETIDNQYCISSNDDLIVDDIPPKKVEVSTNKNIENQIIDLYNSDIDVIEKIDDIEVLENESIIKGQVIENDTSDYKEKEEQEKLNVEIAFNQKKARELVCPRCGSSLIGSSGFCPGCGAEIKTTS